MSADVLTFLQGDSSGVKRDMIARCYYEVAQGDPTSGPVAFAVLLDACAEQFAQTPGKVREAIEHFRVLLVQADKLESKLRDRVETSNDKVILSFKEETRRAHEAWRQTINYSAFIKEEAQLLASGMKPIINSAEQIADDFRSIKGDLKLHHESTEKMLGGVEVLKVIHQENQTLIQRLSKEARANWMTMGYFAGFLLAMIVPPPSSWWLDALLVFGPVALLQWFSRLGWEKKRGTEAVKSGG
jgi:hypothetical protein